MRTAGRLGAGVAVALLVLAVLLPTSGVDTQPPRCWSMPGIEVPCGAGWQGVAAAGAGLAGLVVWWLSRPRRRAASPP